MTIADQKRIDSLHEEIQGLQRAIRRQAEDHTQAISVLSMVRNDVEILKKRAESLELKGDKRGVAESF